MEEYETATSHRRDTMLMYHANVDTKQRHHIVGIPC